MNCRLVTISDDNDAASRGSRESTVLVLCTGERIYDCDDDVTGTTFISYGLTR